MKTPTIRSTTAAMIAIAGIAAAQASTFSVSNSDNRFAIIRSGEGTNKSETVSYRTVSDSAYAGQHFTSKSGTITFAAGVTSNVVFVTEKAVGNVDHIYRYQTDASRSYRFEVLDEGGFNVASTNRVITYGNSYKLETGRVSRNLDDIDLVYFNGSSYASGIGSTKYVDATYTPPSSDVESSGTYQGYALIDDSYDYTKKAAAVSTSPLFTYIGGSGQYHDAIGNKMYATVCFTEKEKNDGYAYVQILAGNGSAAYDTGYDPDGDVKVPTNSLYKACFELKKGSGVYSGEGKQFFPHRYDYVDRTTGSQTSSHTEFFLDEGYLWKHKFKDSSFRATNSGSLVLSPTNQYITTRFDCGGKDNDTFGYKDLFVRLAMVDGKAPTIKSVTVSPGPYHRGNPVTVSIAFSEAVVPSYQHYTGKLETSWGGLKNVGNTGVNVISFTGTIAGSSATNNAPLVLDSFSGVTVSDLAGNKFNGTVARTINAVIAPTTKNYSIVYDLAGGELPDGASNPATYNYDTPRFVLVNPAARPGYVFKGWLGTDISSAKTNVVVYQAHGDRSYKAVWTPIAYPIAYDGATNGVAGISNTNPTSYTVEDGTITLASPTRIGYKFDGWYLDAVRTIRAQTTFPADDMEPKTFYAAWTPVTYTVRFDANGGTGDMPDQTMTYDAPEALAANAFAFPGYAFAGWTGPGSAAYADCATVSNLSAEQGAVVTFLAAWDNSDWADEGRTGDSEEDAYLIYTQWQLDLLSTRVSNSSEYSSKCFRLMADIAYDASVANNFLPIGRERLSHGTYIYRSFEGTFDGNGHTIGGIRISPTAGENRVGLFCLCDEAGVIKNLTLANAVIEGIGYVGGIVCSVEKGTVSNCFVVGTKLKTDLVSIHSGGIVAKTGSIKSIVANAYHDCVIVRDGETNVMDIGVGKTTEGAYGDIPGVAEACYVIATAPGVAIAGEADFAFPVFGATNRYWKAGSTVRLECSDGLSDGQLPAFSVNGEQITGDVFEMPASNVAVSVAVTDGHIWNAPEYVWAEDYTSVTASVVCADCGASWIQVFTATSVVSRAATCTDAGETTWTAEVPGNVFGFTTQTAVQSGVPAAPGHEWVSTNWTWSADYSEASVALECGRDHSHDAVVPAFVTRAGATRDEFTWRATVEVYGESFTNIQVEIREKYPVTVNDGDGGKLTACFANSDSKLVHLDDIGVAPRYRGKSPAGECVYLVPNDDSLVAVSMSASGESIPLLWDPKLCQSYFIMPAHEVTVSAVARPPRGISVDYGCFGVTGCVIRVNGVTLREEDCWSAPPGWPVELGFLVEDGWTGGSLIVNNEFSMASTTNAVAQKAEGLFAATFEMPDSDVTVKCYAVPADSLQTMTNEVHFIQGDVYRAFTPDESGWYCFRLFAENLSYSLYFYREGDDRPMDTFSCWNDDELLDTRVVRLEAGKTYTVDCYSWGSPNSEGTKDVIVIDRCQALTLNEDVGCTVDSVTIEGENWGLGSDDIGIPAGVEVEVAYYMYETNILQRIEVRTANGEAVPFTRVDSDYYCSISFVMPDEPVVVTPFSEFDENPILVLGRNDVPFHWYDMPDYCFVPQESGWYRFRSEALEEEEIDPYVYICDSRGEEIARNDNIDSGETSGMTNLNFCCEAFLAGGKAYRVCMSLVDYQDATNIVPVFVEKTSPHAITVESTPYGRVAVRNDENEGLQIAEAGAGKEVRVYAEPMSDNFVLAKLTAVDASGRRVNLEYWEGYDRYWYFTMPATNVTVSAEFCSKYPKYLDGADDDVLYYYDYWAEEHGYDCYGTNETAFLLNVAPTSIVDNTSLLKIVELGTTNMLVSESASLSALAMMMGYGNESMSCVRVVLASDVAELEQRSDGFRNDICNGYLVLRIGTDISAPMGEWLEASWEMDFEDGRAAIAFPEMLLDMYRDYVSGETGTPVNGLFLSASISSRPADTTGLMYLIFDATGGNVGDVGDDGGDDAGDYGDDGGDDAGDDGEDE